MLSIEELHHQYVVLKKSFTQIAEEYHTYARKLERLAVKHSIPIRSRQQAQRNAIKQGRSKHPTKGKSLTHEQKLTLSQLHTLRWQQMSEEERKQHGQCNKDRDNDQSVRASQDKIREASRRGSRLERELLASLLAHHLQVIFHRDHLVAAEKLEIDLFLPLEKIAIEVNGPSHYQPIWGEEKLAKAQASDQRKYGLLHMSGIHLIIIKHNRKGLPRYYLSGLIEKLLTTINELKGMSEQQAILLESDGYGKKTGDGRRGEGTQRAGSTGGTSRAGQSTTSGAGEGGGESTSNDERPWLDTVRFHSIC